MTSNATPAASGVNIETVLLHMAEAYAVEQALAALLVRPISRPIQATRRLLISLWTKEFGSLRGAQHGGRVTAISRRISGELKALRFDPYAGIVAAGQRGAELGRRQAFEELGRPAAGTPGADPKVPLYAAMATAAAQRKLTDAVDAAITMRAGTVTEAARAIDMATQAQRLAERAATTVFHERLNDAVSDVAEQFELLKMWVAEPDACPTCLALSGHAVPPDGQFPSELTFGSRAISWVPADGLNGPPRHPHCRCRLVPFDPHFAEIQQVLKDRARQSFLDGSQSDTANMAAQMLAKKLSGPKNR